MKSADTEVRPEWKAGKPPIATDAAETAFQVPRAPRKKYGGPQVHRATADRMLARVLARIPEVNCHTEYLYEVRAALVFGSYLDSGRDRVGDLDFVPFLEPRVPPESKESWKCRVARMSAAFASGRTFPNLTAEAFWPEMEVYRAIKAHQPKLSLHAPDDIAALDPIPTYKVVFGDPEWVREKLSEWRKRRLGSRAKEPRAGTEVAR